MAGLCGKLTLLQWLDKRYFLVGMVLVIALAAIYPDAGAKGGVLESKTTSGWVAVCTIFFLSGWSLKTKELVKAALYCKLNSVTQLFSLLFIPLVCYAVVNLLYLTSLDAKLLKGLLISSCLPTTVSMCVVLTKTAEGNDAAAIFNAAFGNLLGIFVTPVLILVLVGNESSMALGEVLLKLVLKILVPLAVGQCVQFGVSGARGYYTAHKKQFKRVQETLLLWIVYTTFCQTFHVGTDAKAPDFIATLVLVVALYVFFCACSFHVSGLAALNFSRRDRVAVLFCATHKTVAAGIPMLNTIFEGHADLGMFVLPLLIWHPLQLFMGSAGVPWLTKWVNAEERSVKEREEAEDGDAKPAPQPATAAPPVVAESALAKAPESSSAV